MFYKNATYLNNELAKTKSILKEFELPFFFSTDNYEALNFVGYFNQTKVKHVIRYCVSNLHESSGVNIVG